MKGGRWSKKPFQPSLWTTFNTCDFTVLLFKVYPNFIKILSRFYPDILSWFYPDILPRFLKTHFIQILS
jgi:hypothetical protein